MTGSLKGRLLVASPAFRDPNFDRTVVLVLEHGTEGAVGVVLNRPTSVEVATPLPRWERYAAPPAVVFVGGPVAPGAAVCLARAGSAGPGDQGWTPVLDRLGTLDLEIGPERVSPRIEQIRVFAGYAGWGPGQLDAEVAAGVWFGADLDPADALSPHAGDLWRTVLRRQRGRLALAAAFPLDPAMN